MRGLEATTSGAAGQAPITCVMRLTAQEEALVEIANGFCDFHAQFARVTRAAEKFGEIPTDRPEIDAFTREVWKKHSHAELTWMRIADSHQDVTIWPAEARAEPVERYLVEAIDEWIKGDLVRSRRVLQTLRRGHDLDFLRDRIPNEVRWDTFARCDYRCVMCGARGGSGPNKTPLVTDHILPVAVGGSSLPYNLQTLCSSCNSSKRDRVLDGVG